MIQKSRRMLQRGALIVFAAMAAMGSASAQDSYPSRPIKLVVGLPAGGPSDLLARTLASGLSEKLGSNIIVENRGGAGGSIAAAAVAKSPADGYTIYFAAMPAVVFVPLLNDKLPYDQKRDFSPIGMFASYTLFLFANSELPVKSIADLIALARAKPGELTYASGGNGTSNHLAGELLKSMAGIDIVHIPYKGNVLAQQDVISGRVSMMFDFLSTSQQHVKTGRLRMLGQTGKSRTRFAPDVPTFDESGLRGYDVTAWFGLFAPAATPRPIIEALNSALRSALSNPGMQEKLHFQGYEVTPTSPEELSARIEADRELWAPIFKKAGIKAE